MDLIVHVIFLIITFFYILFCPGLIISFIFYDYGKIDYLERIALSFALSITTLPLLTFYLNLLGFRIFSGLIIFEVIIISEISFVVYFVKQLKGNK